MDTLLQVLLNSISSVALYVQLALGLSIFLGVFRILNFAQGDFATVGGYAIFTTSASLGVGIYAASIAGIVVGGLLGAAFYFVIVKPLGRAPAVNQILATFGLALFLQGALQWLYSASPRNVEVSDRTIRIGPGHVPLVSLINLAVAIALIAILFVVLYKTAPGRRVRAVSENQIGAQLVGINTGRASVTACIIGGALASGAALVLLTAYFLTPTVGFLSIFKAFTVVVAGGLGNLKGVLVASIALGIAESSTTYAISGAAGEMVGFIIIVLILLARPTGLGRRRAL